MPQDAKAETPHLLPFPQRRRFAVIRLNPVAMIEHLKLDQQALDAARSMRNKKYLVYLYAPHDLPFPDSLWCRYSVEPVATVLRPYEPARGLAPDMVMPISPNTKYAKGRDPISPETPFPFRNCFFWIDSAMTVRIPGRPDGYDDTRAIQLSLSSNFDVMTCWKTEHPRIDAALDLLEKQQRHKTELPQEAAGTSTGLPSSNSSVIVESAHSMNAHDSTSDDRHSLAHSDATDTSVQDILDLNPFGWEYDPAVEYIPLVDLWFELEEHLSEDTIPDPLDMFKERDFIAS
ncbi:hypothetical protein C8Q76DRAFT_608046 [Earliella scabrosa]|nr:hypothetical protein C8Q76DRAFT_608046 [Earliella scabrosa]